MNLVPLIELSRGGTPECLHLGAVAVVNVRGQLLAQAGDPHWLTFSRSTLKALQALPFMEAGGAAQFGLGPQQLAMLCASHNGEDMHVAQTDTMLAQAGLDYKALRCGCHVPGLFTLLDLAPPACMKARSLRPVPLTMSGRAIIASLSWAKLSPNSPSCAPLARRA